MQKRYSLCILLVFLLMFALGQTNQKSEEIKQPQPESVQVEISDIKVIAKGTNAQWSPDGKSIAFLVSKKSEPPSLAAIWLGGDIWIINSDGKREPQELTYYGFVQHFVWSPNSKEIVYICNEYIPKRQSRLNIVDVKSGKIRTIYGPWNTDTIYLRDIWWLKDNTIRFFENSGNYLNPKWVVINKYGSFPKTITSKEKIVYSHFNEALWIMNADGTEKKRLVWPEKPNVSFGEPAWSKEAKKIAVYVEDSSATYTALTDENGEMWQILADSGFGQEWSPDGKWIICGSYIGPWKGKFRHAELYLISSDGKYKFQLTKISDIEGVGAKWSPDGTKILFETPTSNIFVAKLKIK